MSLSKRSLFHSKIYTRNDSTYKGCYRFKNFAIVQNWFIESKRIRQPVVFFLDQCSAACVANKNSLVFSVRVI